MSQLEQQHEEQLLTQKGRINYEYILGRHLLTIQQAILAKKYSEIQETIDGLIAIIPEQFKDQKFHDELESAKSKKTEYTYCCGFPVKGSDKEVIVFDSFKKLNVCINLLHRRGMISKTMWHEIATGRKAKKQTEEGLTEEEILGDAEP